ncbi:putative cyclin-dependent serine/threonine-protein kinase DDB_G0272797/DDB_G0274007 [Drosophila novamexicana]|uniref:putative cyclin-dependent serine/threonine-protein kinase DDB_G0272797/DDB_G0274007 n=1 Tax=Drosophila novamexicana TaxID=47314 RepID=UPI0011E5BCF8|nr:putative cyclin-dependent serine/threonine-protein kinase DDB_G0272797/DDB_G0274007 [Drosophila novamexicana]
MQLLLVVATVAICGVVQAQQGVDPAYLRQYYQQLQQQQQQQQPSDGTPIYEQNSEQTQQYVSSGQQIRIKDTVAEQIRAQQQQSQGYVAPAVRDYLQQPQYQSQAQPSVYRQPQAAPAPPPRRVQPAYQASSAPLLGKGQHKLQSHQQLQQQQQQAEEEEQYDDQNSSYQFGFDVKDDEFTNYQNRKEVRDGGVIKGSYSVVDSDGFIRTVKYTADPKEGFKAEVIREPTDIVVKIPTPPPPTQLLRSGLHKAPQEYSQAKQQYQHQQHQQQQQQPQYHQYQ